MFPDGGAEELIGLALLQQKPASRKLREKRAFDLALTRCVRGRRERRSFCPVRTSNAGYQASMLVVMVSARYCAWGMRIRHHLLTQCRITRFAAPILSEGNKELLIAGEAILSGSGLVAERSVVSVIGGGNSSDVCDVFSQRLFAINR